METTTTAGTLAGKMPPKRQRDLTAAQRRALHRCLRDIQAAEDTATAARVRFAELAQELGIAAVARELDVSHEAIRQRVASVRSRKGR